MSTFQKNSDTLIVAYINNLDNKVHLNEFLYSVAMQKYQTDLLLLHGGLSEKELEELQDIIDKPQIDLTVENPNYEEGAEGEKGNKTIVEKAASIFPVNQLLKKSEAENFADIFNEGFQYAIDNDYEFFSIAEADDVYSVYWVDTARKYAEEKPEISIFSPIIRNVIHGAFNGYYNEACWAEGMAEEAGKYDTNLLLKFNCLSPLGAIFRVKQMAETEDAIEIRNDKMFPMKRNIKLSSPYEFFLRMVYNDLEIMNIPRLGYEQRMLRKAEFSQISSKIPQNIMQLPPEKGGMSREEVQFWHKTATDAYFMEDDEEEYEFIQA